MTVLAVVVTRQGVLLARMEELVAKLEHYQSGVNVWSKQNDMQRKQAIDERRNRTMAEKTNPETKTRRVAKILGPSLISVFPEIGDGLIAQAAAAAEKRQPKKKKRVGKKGKKKGKKEGGSRTTTPRKQSLKVATEELEETHVPVVPTRVRTPRTARSSSAKVEHSVVTPATARGDLEASRRKPSPGERRSKPSLSVDVSSSTPSTLSKSPSFRSVATEAEKPVRRSSPPLLHKIVADAGPQTIAARAAKARHRPFCSWGNQRSGSFHIVSERSAERVKTIIDKDLSVAINMLTEAGKKDYLTRAKAQWLHVEVGAPHAGMNWYDVGDFREFYDESERPKACVWQLMLAVAATVRRVLSAKIPLLVNDANHMPSRAPRLNHFEIVFGWDGDDIPSSGTVVRTSRSLPHPNSSPDVVLAFTSDGVAEKLPRRSGAAAALAGDLGLLV